MILSSLVNPFISIPVFGLAGVSLFLIASTTPSLLGQQLISFVIGIGLFIFFSTVDYKIWRKYYWIIYIFSIIILTFSLMGNDIRGAKRWIEIGGLTIQPSELIKPFIILFFAYQFSTRKISSFFNIFIIIVMFLPLMLLIFKQPDLGNVIIYTSVLFSFFIISELPLIYYVIIFTFSIIIAPLSWFILQNYQKQRIISFLNPNLDPVGAGYNAIQAIIAIGSGQLFGLGLGRGTQSRLLFLPEYHTDFVFASLGEELGFIGGFIVILLYFVILAKILLIGYNCDHKFGRMVCIGLFTQIFIQVFINIGMNLGLLPITGITLPLVSYGGNSIISTFIGLGLLISVSNDKKNNPLVIR